MTPAEQEAMAALCLMAAFADGRQDDAERAAIKAILESGDGPAPAVYQAVLLKKTTPESAAPALATPEARMLAYEMCVCVCDADGAASPEEKAFLEKLRGLLGIDAPAAQAVLDAAEGLAQAAAPAPAAALPAAAAPPADAALDQEIEGTVLRYAIMAGGLELLPQGLASMAIVPLQMKLVYDVGKRYGYQLDAGHAREFLAIAGIGMTSQVFENVARKFLGGFARAALGRGMGRMANAAAGAAVTFGTTFALGRAAHAYYKGGRSLSAVDLKAIFQQGVQEAQQLYAQHAGAVEQSARTANLASIGQFVRGA